MTQKIFLIDANSIITPYRAYYPFDLAGSFWSQLSQHIEEGRIAILDVILDEILKGNDDLTRWMKAIHIKNSIDHRESQTIVYYAQILQFIQNSPLYKQSALSEWSRASVADPWLIAAAKSHGYSIVTLEEGNSNPNPKSPWKAAKIPDIAAEFDVEVVNLFAMMRELKFRL